jgi:hypothetical protein
MWNDGCGTVDREWTKPVGSGEKDVLHQPGWCYSKADLVRCMKKLVLIIALSVFGATAVATAPFGGNVVVAQKRDKDDKKNTPGPPVIKDKGNQDKSKQSPPKKDKKP